MKLIITQTDFQVALVAYLALSGINVVPDQLEIDLDEIEINLNPEQDSNTTTEAKPKKRTRRSKAEIQAEEQSPAKNEPEEDEDTFTLSDIVDEIQEAPEEVTSDDEPESLFG